MTSPRKEAGGNPEGLAPRTYVTLGFLQGPTRNVWIQNFSPYSLRLFYHEAIHAPAQNVDANRLAFVGFRREEGKVEPPRKDTSSMTEIKVHLLGGQIFQVMVPSLSFQRNIGFMGLPSTPDSPFHAIYFYPHGVKLTEDVQRLGELLLKAGHLKQSDLQQGVERLDVQRKMPLGQILVEQKKISQIAVEQARSQQVHKKLRIGEVLIQEGLVSAQDVAHALKEQKKKRGKRLGEILIEMNVIDERVLYQSLARKFHMPFIDLDEVKINPQAVAAIDRKILTKYGAFPLDTNDNTLVVAISDPLRAEIYGVLRFTISKSIVEVIALPSQIKRYLKKYAQSDAEKPASEKPASQKPASPPVDANLAPKLEPPVDLPEKEPPTAELDGIIVKLANKIILDAQARGASDIHVEPNGPQKNAVIRFRVDGECELYRELLPQYAHTLITRFKSMAQLDLSEQRKPQDGKIRLPLRQGAIELRLATVPTVQGNEDAVLSLLAASAVIPLDELGLEVANRRALLEIIHKPYGLILCVGPTGSGKTTTLHAILHSLNRVDTKIWTAEDPVEITQERMRQVQVNPKIGFDFAVALRAFLRADPDVILIGEMRDQETGAIALEASLTGHLVLSTLPTHSAAETIIRLLKLGLDAFAFSDALLGIVSQRLVRRLCQKCRESYKPSFTEAKEIVQLYGEGPLKERYGFQIPQDINLFCAKGCEGCRKTGYKGRVAIQEILVNSDELKGAIERSAGLTELREITLKSGMRTLCQDGLDKALTGQTDLGQVFSTCMK